MSLESIFFMVSQFAKRIFEILWNFPNIPQKSVAVFHGHRKRRENRRTHLSTGMCVHGKGVPNQTNA